MGTKGRKLNGAILLQCGAQMLLMSYGCLRPAYPASCCVFTRQQGVRQLTIRMLLVPLFPMF